MSGNRNRNININNSNHFDGVPDDVLKNIFSYLDTNSLISVSKTSSRFYGVTKSFFQQPLSKFVEILPLAKNLLNVAMSKDTDTTSVQTIFMELDKFGLAPSFSISIATQRTKGEETKCGRKWKNVSALEYAAWSGNVHLVRQLLSHTPQKCKPQALKQLQSIQKKGLVHGQLMAPFYDLIEAYNTYINNFDKFENDDARAQYCTKTLGTLQNQLPESGLQALCSSPAGIDTLGLGEKFYMRFTAKFSNSEKMYIFTANACATGLKHYYHFKYGASSQELAPATLNMKFRRWSRQASDFLPYKEAIEEKKILEEFCEVRLAMLDREILNLKIKVDEENDFSQSNSSFTYRK